MCIKSFPFPTGGPLTVGWESLSRPTKAMLARPRPFHLRFWAQPDLGTDRSCLFILPGRGVSLFACLTPSNNSFIFPVHNNLLRKTSAIASSAIRSDRTRSQSGRPSNGTSFVVGIMQIRHCFLCTNAGRRLRIMIISIWWLSELIRSLLHTLCVIAIRHELDSIRGSLFEERVVMYGAVFDFFRNKLRFSKRWTFRIVYPLNYSCQFRKCRSWKIVTSRNQFHLHLKSTFIVTIRNNTSICITNARIVLDLARIFVYTAFHRSGFPGVRPFLFSSPHPHFALSYQVIR